MLCSVTVGNAVDSRVITGVTVLIAEGAAIAAVEAGQGIAFGPPAYAVVAGKRAKYLPIVPPVPPVRLGCVLCTGRVSAEVVAFVESLRAACAGMVTTD